MLDLSEGERGTQKGTEGQGGRSDGTRQQAEAALGLA